MINGITSTATYISQGTSQTRVSENTGNTPETAGLSDSQNATSRQSNHTQPVTPVRTSGNLNENIQDTRTSGGGAPQAQRASNTTAPSSEEDNTNAEGLTPEEEKTVQEMKQRDAEVRAHEQAHKTVGGPYASAPSYTTQTGPDGRQYAVAGEVKIDSSAVPNNPDATIRKMDIVIRAALAPAEPSPQDQQVAQQAQQIKFQAQAELNQQRQEELREATGEDNGNTTALEELRAEISENPSGDKSESFTPIPKEFIEAFDKAAEIFNPFTGQTVNFSA